VGWKYSPRRALGKQGLQEANDGAHDALTSAKDIVWIGSIFTKPDEHNSAREVLRVSLTQCRSQFASPVPQPDLAFDCRVALHPTQWKM
jgi:hypothetical protein